MAETLTQTNDDIFARPSEFRLSTVRAVWEKAKPVKGKPDCRYDWRNGKVIGPWQEGTSRDGVWDIGHIEPWYRVVERLKEIDSITRDMVLDEFNNIDNLGVEDPETNRALGVNSRRLGGMRLPYSVEEDILFGDMEEAEREVWRERFHREIDRKSAHVDARMQYYSNGQAAIDVDKQEEDTPIALPKRVIVWDTETTGLSPKNGDKIVEIGALELVDGKPTGKKYHQYINPERPIPARATKVHGITDDMVKDKPVFKDIAQEFLDFVGDAPLVAHNASFDMRFINAELEQAGRDTIGDDRKIDTLRLAKKLLPDLESHDLDTLAEHFKVDTSGRDDFHGGLVDTIILAGVYKGLADMAEQQKVDVLKARTAGIAGGDNDNHSFRDRLRAEGASAAKGRG